ncbi:MAG: tRNA (adenosine(37)-N6)-dimethylallyltransferase MiaA [Planctomycetaceae bacterium]
MKLPIDILQRCRFLAGPTASGKTEIALLLADRLGAEIVSLDSMALYRGMDVGTAKPSAEQRARVPHHLIDVIDPHEEYSVAEYLAAVETACREILLRGRTPLFVGGTGLYLRSVLRGVFAGPSADWVFRRQLVAEAESQGPAFLHEKLQRTDPDAAANLHPRDQRRIIRALEVYHVTGRRLSEQQQHPPLPEDLRPRNVYWLNPPRSWLHARINCRVEQMISAGLVDEVRRLLQGDPPMGRTARQALGYKEMIDHLAGGRSLEKTIARIQVRTRQFAKRQCTWFRNLEECRSIDVTGDECADELAAGIESFDVADP